MARRHVVWACCALGCSKEAPAPIYADLAGARSLVLFGADVRRDVTLEAGLLAKTLEDGTLDHVFPEEGWFAPPDNFPQGPIYVVSLEVSVSGLALISLGSPVWFTEYGAEATDGELAPGVWC